MYRSLPFRIFGFLTLTSFLAVWGWYVLPVVDAQTQTLTVTTTADNNDNINPTPGSFRAALVRAVPGTKIIFNLPKTDPGFANGVFTLKPTAPYKSIDSGTVTIDGTTQTAFGGDTNPQGPEIFISGELGLNAGLVIVSPGNVIRGIGLINCRGGDGGTGILLDGDSAKNNQIVGCFIGVGPNGTQSAPNTRGITVNESNSNQIGGPMPADRNVISGNMEFGIVVSGSQTQGTVIQNNVIGPAASGESIVSGTGIQGIAGISIGGIQNRVVGNVISGNGNNQGGIGLLLSGDQNVIVGNRIGTNSGGTKALGNGLDGISLGGAKNQIGGTNASDGNLISGNGRNGLRIGFSPGASENLIQGNILGADLTGKTALPNDGFGVVVLDGAHDNLIGGSDPGAGNIIAFNNRSGVGVVNSDPANPTIRNHISRNSIFQNAEIGIDLGANGVTPNDFGDADEGPNDLMNFPVLQTFEVISGNDIKITGQSNLGSTVEIFVADPDPTGFGEGKQFLASINVGKETLFSATVTLPAGAKFLTATASDDKGSTSEFSKNFDVGSGPPPPNDTIPPQVTLTAPNGGEKLKTGRAFNITWTATDNVGVVSQSIQLSTDGGKTFATTIVGSLPGTAGSFSWTPPGPTKAGRVKIIAKDAAGNMGEAVSGGNFKVK